MINFSSDKHSKNSGFTLLEMLIVASIIVILSVIVLVNYEFGGYTFALSRSAYKLAQDVRRVEEMAMSAREHEGSVPVGGYGIYLTYTNIDDTYYLIFADDGNGTYEVGEEVGPKINFEENVKISHICFIEPDGSCESNVSVTFIPPDPLVEIDGGAPTSTVQVTLYSPKIAEDNKVLIRPAGLVEIVD